MSREGSTAARKWAQRNVPLGPCWCGEPGAERHHPSPTNPRQVVCLCRTHHRLAHPVPFVESAHHRDARGRFACSPST